MTRTEADDHATRMAQINPTWSVTVVRILPDHADPIIDGDNGWDVEIDTDPQ